MSSEKPFWKGKTLMEIQNLDKRVKVTMENGDVFIGKLVRRSRDTDGICSLSMQLDAHRTYLHVFSAESSDTQPIIPSYVDTVELLDDPNYERIEEADDLQEKDIAVMLDGNRYKAADVEKGCFSFYEVKSCMADFTSGNGLTFYGDQNYLVCTKELCDEIVWQKMVPERVNAILTPDSTGSKLILGYVQSYNDMSYRRRPASEILWAMVKENGKRTN